MNGSAFSEHPNAAGAAVLTFPANTASQLRPGDTVFTMFSVRTTSSSLSGRGQFTAANTNSAGLGAHLTYGVRQVSGTTCNQSTYSAGSVVVADNSALTVGSTTWQALQAAGANQANYCLRVALPSGVPNSAQGLSLNAQWIVQATTEQG